MCDECVKAKADLFPDATDEEFGEILWNYTCHPAGGYPQIREQLEEVAADLRAGRSPDDRILAEMDAAHAHFKASEEE